jgi:peptidoglycan/LPS O-acetylase OafA/YrhL
LTRGARSMTTSAIPAGSSTAAFGRAGAKITTSPYRFLGAFRCLLALLVLASHAVGFLHDGLGPLGLGNVGVMLFFIVSGFVICEALDLFYRDSPTRFLLNRCLKIFPAYWAALPLGYAVIALTTPETLRADPLALFVNVTMLTAYLPGNGTLLVVSIAWAVIVEFQFYFLAAAVSFAGRAVGHRAVVAGGTLAAALALYLFTWWMQGQTRFYGAFQFAPFFVFGSLAYFAVTRRDIRVLPFLILAFIFSVHAYYVYNARGEVAPGLWLGANGARWNVVSSTILFITLCGVFFYLVSGRFQKSLERIDKRLGDITYALYLVHMPLVALAHYLNLAGIVGFAFVLASSLAAAGLIQRAIERPVGKLRDLLRGTRLYD